MARIKPKQLLIQSKTKKSPSRISYSSIITWNLIVVLVVLSLYATYRQWHHRPSFEAEMDLPLDENVERSEDSTKISTPNYAVMDTAKGSITIEIYKDASAGVVDRFVKLCKTDYFKGMPFRHVIKNFVIQGGDFDFNGAAQEWILKAKASGENTLSPKHEAFMIGTTKSPNSKGFDIFITTAPIPDLNDKIVVFGRVIKGEDIVQDAATGVGFRLLDGLTILLLLHLLAIVATHAVAAAAMMLLLPSPLSTALLQNTMVKLIYVYTVYTPQNHITNTHKQRN